MDMGVHRHKVSVYAHTGLSFLCIHFLLAHALLTHPQSPSLSTTNRPQILQQLRQDAVFLGRLGIVDYRLFVGVHAYLNSRVTPVMRKLLRRCNWDHSAQWPRFEGGLLSTVPSRATAH